MLRSLRAEDLRKGAGPPFVELLHVPRPCTGCLTHTAHLILRNNSMGFLEYHLSWVGEEIEA